MSQLAFYFKRNQFCILLEYLSASKDGAIPQSLAGFPCAITLADRVHADDDMPPLELAKAFPSDIDKLIHYSGKGRDIAEFEAFLKLARASGQKNLLLLTGDKLKKHNDGENGERSRYLESVNAVMATKQYGDFHVGVAFNPFKYTEAEKDAQYFKLHKKLKAGADFIITQLGYDIGALQEVRQFLLQHQYQQKILACVMPITLARAKFMLKNKVAGIVITPHMLDVLTQEKQQGLNDQVYLRCALQILMCKHLGFAGVHLSSCHKPEEQQLLEGYLEEYRHLDFEVCKALWESLWGVKTGKELQAQPEHYSRPMPTSQILKYRHLHLMHDAMFDSKVAKGIGGLIFKSRLWNQSTANKVLLKTELMSKHSVVGCESCGQCRLGATLYICPETCPKGLANGPCGGTSLDRCEFGDRECIHSVKARLAKAVKQTDILKQELIPTVPLEIRGTSSWKNWYLATEA